MPSHDPAHEVLEDYRLVQAVLRKDRIAARELAERLTCIPRMLEALNRRTGRRLSSHDIEDLSQDIAALILQKLPEYRPLGRLEGWIYRICSLQMLNAVRSAQRRSLAGGSQELESMPTEDGLPEDVLAYELVQAKLERLGPPSEEVIRLKDLEGRTFTEIAEILQTSPNTVKARYYRGLEMLRLSLGVRGDG